MKKSISKITFALIVATSMLLTGCSSGNTTVSDTSTETEGANATTETEGDNASTETTDEVNYKDELNIAITANPPTLDVHGSSSNIVAGIGQHIYEPLFALNSDYEPTPVLAESYEVDESGLVYTIKLREGIMFHNGQEMVADDVVASMTHWLEASSKANTLIGGSVFEKVDDYTVTLTVNKAASDIMLILANPSQFAAIYPKSSVDAATAEGISDYIGTGPYYLEEFAVDQYVKLAKYVNYKSLEGEPSGFTGAKNAPTETLYFRIVTDDTTRIGGVQTGEYDISESIPLENFAELSLDETLSLSSKPTGSLNLFLNTQTGVLADENMRQAVIAALNCDDIMLAAFGDENLYSLYPGMFNESNIQWANEGGSEYYNQNNIEKAKELLAEAGYNDEPIVLVTTPDYSEMYKSTLVVQEQLKQAGMNAVVESYDFNTFMEYRADINKFDLFITSNSYGLLPVQLSILSESWSGFNAPEVQEGIDAIRFASSSEEASQEWENLQTFIYEYGAESVLGHYYSIIAPNSEVEGFDNFHYPIYWNAKIKE
ncbi:MAG: ABC transporter substrate-binding protein [Lachnospirales bacterium]